MRGFTAGEVQTLGGAWAPKAPHGEGGIASPTRERLRSRETSDQRDQRSRVPCDDRFGEQAVITIGGQGSDPHWLGRVGGERG